MMLNYKREGTGEPLLLIHGFGISFNIWDDLLPLLRDQFSLIQIELPGIGASPPPKQGQNDLDAAVEGIEQVRAALKIERWHILSYSSGTRVGERYIYLCANRVDHAMFICPAKISSRRALGLRLAIQLDTMLPQLGNWVLSGARLQYLINLLGFNSQPNERSPRWFQEISLQSIEILKVTLRSLAHGGAKPFSMAGNNILFIWADEDRIIEAPRLSSRDRVIHANHSAAQTAAHPLAELILPFLGSKSHTV